MANDTQITVIGNLTGDVELRFTPSGSAVANFTIASTPSVYDKQSSSFKDGETLFLRASVWREAAENVAETLTKGMRVVAQGRLKSRSYEDKSGEKRTVIELEVDEIGPSLRFASAKVTRTQRGQGGNQQQGGGAATFNPVAASQGGSGWGAPSDQQAAQNFGALGGQQAGGWGNQGGAPF